MVSIVERRDAGRQPQRQRAPFAFAAAIGYCYAGGLEEMPGAAGRVQRDAMKVRIASDVGGTFTDSIAYDPASRRIAVAKLPTTPQARDMGTVGSIKDALAQLGLTGSAV